MLSLASFWRSSHLWYLPHASLLWLLAFGGASRLIAESTPAGAPQAAAAGSPLNAAQAVKAQQKLAAGDLYLDGSRAYIHVGKVGLGHEHAVVGQLLSGTIHLDAPEDAGELVFDMRSFVADTDDARRYIGLEGSTDESTQRQVNANMLGRHVLDVERFPLARFEIKKVVPLKPEASGEARYEMSGNFTLHGTTRPIKFIAVADTKARAGWTHLRGNFSILQSEFGMKPFTKAFGAIGVTDELQIHGDLWIAQQAVALKPSAGVSR
jgi:polyisoprenoid-binding protein YceI